MSKTAPAYRELLCEICEIIEAPISTGVVATEALAMLAESEKLAHPSE